MDKQIHNLYKSSNLKIKLVINKQELKLHTISFTFFLMNTLFLIVSSFTSIIFATAAIEVKMKTVVKIEDNLCNKVERFSHYSVKQYFVKNNRNYITHFC